MDAHQLDVTEAHAQRMELNKDEITSKCVSPYSNIDFMQTENIICSLEKTYPTVTKDSKKIQSTTKVLLNLKNTGMGR
jgi:hypothetical protein